MTTNTIDLSTIDLENFDPSKYNKAQLAEIVMATTEKAKKAEAKAERKNRRYNEADQPLLELNHIRLARIVRQTRRSDSDPIILHFNMEIPITAVQDDGNVVILGHVSVTDYRAVVTQNKGQLRVQVQHPRKYNQNRTYQCVWHNKFAGSGVYLPRSNNNRDARELDALTYAMQEVLTTYIAEVGVDDFQEGEIYSEHIDFNFLAASEAIEESVGNKGSNNRFMALISEAKKSRDEEPADASTDGDDGDNPDESTDEITG